MADGKTPSGSLNSTAIGFGVGMLIVGLVLGYLFGSAGGTGEGSGDKLAEAPGKTAPRGDVVNASGGTLKRLSDEEKKELLAKKADPEQAAPPPPADSPFATAELLARIDDPVVRSEYERAVGFMDKGNARAAKPVLTKLWDDSAGKPWRDEVGILLADADVTLGDVRSARTQLDAWRKEFGSSPHAPAAAVIEAKALAQEGRRLGGRDKGGMTDAQTAKYREAVARFDRAAEEWPQHPAMQDGLFNKAALLTDLGDLAEAEKAALQLATRFPQARLAPRSLYNVGRAAYDAGDYDTAERLYQRLVDDYPKERLARTARGAISELRLLGEAAPGLEADEWVGDDPGPLAGLEGEVVVLVFWATWCPHCRREMPEIQAGLYERWKDRGVRFVGVTRHSKGQTTETVREFVSQHGIAFPQAIDSGTTSRSYNVTGIPAAAIIGRDGTVAFRNHPKQITDELLEKLVGKS